MLADLIYSGSVLTAMRGKCAINPVGLLLLAPERVHL
jgi:hypothetical protein